MRRRATSILLPLPNFSAVGIQDDDGVEDSESLRVDRQKVRASAGQLFSVKHVTVLVPGGESDHDRPGRAGGSGSARMSSGEDSMDLAWPLLGVLLRRVPNFGGGR